MNTRVEILTPVPTAVEKKKNSCSRTMDEITGCCKPILRHHEEHGGLLMNSADKPNVEEKLWDLSHFYMFLII